MKVLTDSVLLFRRSVGEGRRDPGPAYVLPAMPPLLMVLVFTALFDRIADRPGFGPGAYVEVKPHTTVPATHEMLG